MRNFWTPMLVLLMLGCAQPPADEVERRKPEARLALRDESSVYVTDATIFRNGHLVFLGELEGKQRALEFFVTPKPDLESSLGKTLLIEARAPDSDAHSYIRFPRQGEEVLLVRGGVLTITKLEPDWLEVELVLDCEKGPIEGTLKSPLSVEKDHKSGDK